jgi:O-antigen/teichoic acid export membrane protein
VTESPSDASSALRLDTALTPELDGRVVTRARGLRSLLGDSAIYGIGVAAAPLALLLGTPVIARSLGPLGFGSIDVLTAVITVVGLVAILGMDGAGVRSFYDYGPDQALQRRLVVRTVIAIVTVSALSFAVTLLTALIVLETAVFHSSLQTVEATVAALVAMPLITVQTISRETFRFDRRRGSYVVAGILQGFVGVLAAVLLVKAGLGARGYFIGLGIGAAIGLLFALAVGRFRLTETPSIDRTEARRMLRYGLPLVPASVAIWVVFAIDRTLLASMKGFFQAGLYGLASKASAPLVMAISAFTLAWGPFILSQPPERHAELRARALTAATAASAAICLCVIVFERQIIDVLGGPDFALSTRAVPGIALGWVAWAAAVVLATEFAISRRTVVIGVMTGVAALANIVLNLILIPPFGYIGAAWTSAISFFFLAGLYWWWERRTGSAPYRWWRLATIALVLGTLVPLAVSQEQTLQTWMQVSICAVGVVVLGLVAATDRPAARIGS